MLPNNKPFIGYEVRVHGGASHRGITSNPERRLREHQAQLGPSARMRVLTPPMSLPQARNWERAQTRTRGYVQPRRRPGRVWVRPHRRNGKVVRGHYRRA